MDGCVWIGGLRMILQAQGSEGLKPMFHGR